MIKKIILLSCVYLLSSCSEYKEKNVTKNEKLWGGYQIGEVYELIYDTFLLQVDYEGDERLVLSPEGNLKKKFRNFYSVPPSINRYLSGHQDELTPGNAYTSPTRVVSVIPKNTKIQIIKFIEFYSFSFFFGEIYGITVYAKILNPVNSDIIVDLKSLSWRYEIKESYNLSKPNKKVLKLLTPNKLN